MKKTGQLVGRNELYTKVVFDQQKVGEKSDFEKDFYTSKSEIENGFSGSRREIDKEVRGNEKPGYREISNGVYGSEREIDVSVYGSGREIENGDYVAVKIVGARSSVLSGIPLYRTTLTEFYRDKGWADRMAVRVGQK